MKPFEALTYAGQVRRLRRLAQPALQAYGLAEAQLTPLTNSENMTFRVDAPGHIHYVLRIHRPHRQSAAIRSELLWLAALRQDTDLIVPTPLPALDGALVVPCTADGVPGPRLCVMFRWIDGTIAGDRLDTAMLRMVGVFMARLHQHAAQFVPPAGFTRGRLAQESFASHMIAPRLGATGPLWNADDALLCAAAHERLWTYLGTLGEGPELFGLIHADLHQWNYLFHDHQVRVIDFDDCCWSYYFYDIAVTLLMLRGRTDYAPLRASFLEGYRSIRALPAEAEEQIEPFMIMRRLIVIGWLLGELHNPELRAWATSFIPESLAALRAFVGAS